MKLRLLLAITALLSASDSTANDERIYLHQLPQSLDGYFQSTLYRISSDNSVTLITFDTNFAILKVGQGNISTSIEFPCLEKEVVGRDNSEILINLSHDEFCYLDTQLTDFINITDNEISYGQYLLLLEVPRTVTNFVFDASLIEKAHVLISEVEFSKLYPRLHNQLHINKNQLVLRSEQRYFQALLLTYKEH